MLKGYEEGNFGTGPSYMQINSRKDAQNIKASFTVIAEVLPSTAMMRMTVFHHQENEDLN